MLLPKVADQLEKTFSGTAADNIEQMSGATARLDNQTGLLLDTFNQTFGITTFFAKIKNGVADTLAAVRLAVRDGDWLQFFGAFAPGTAIPAILGKLQVGGNDPALIKERMLAGFRDLPAQLRKAKLELLKDSADNAKNESEFLGNGYERKQALERYKQYSAELVMLQRENLKLLVEDGKEAQIKQRESDKSYHEKRVQDVKDHAKELSLTERNALIGKFNSQISADQAKIRANPNLVTSLTRDINYAKEFIGAIQEVNKELDKKDKKDAIRDAKANTRSAKQAGGKSKTGGRCPVE